MPIVNNITELIGNTPVIKLNRLAPEGVDMYVKLESANPMGSVKDRMALGIVEAAEKAGTLKPGGTVVEATSGNTGIALSMICAQRGYSFVAVMASSFSVERRKIMRALGAKVILTPASLGGTGMVKKAEELAEKHGWLLARQFENDANPDFHMRTTGPEILRDFEGKRLDYWVTGWGTGGTFTGVSQVLKEARPDIKIVLSEPTPAQLVASGIRQERKEVLGQWGAPAGSHPAWKPHPIQGWTPNFIPLVMEKGIDAKHFDEVLPVEAADGMKTAMALMRDEGIFTGTSGGATVRTALDVAQKAPKGSVILAMLPDTAERYLSTPLFASIEEGMTEEEKALGKTTDTEIFE